MGTDSVSFAANEARMKSEEGVEAAHCNKCSRLLRVKESIERGIGPVCLKRLHVLEGVV